MKYTKLVDLKVLVALAFMFSVMSSTPVKASNIVYSCKVRALNLLEIEEGIAAQYGGYSDGFGVDSDFNIEIQVSKEKLGVIAVKQNGSLIGLTVIESKPSYLGDLWLYQDGKVWVTDKGGRRISLDDNSLSVSSGGGVRIKMKRYWKNDWSALIVKVWGGETTPLSTESLVASCHLESGRMGAVKEQLHSWSRPES